MQGVPVPAPRRRVKGLPRARSADPALRRAPERVRYRPGERLHPLANATATATSANLSEA